MSKTLHVKKGDTVILLTGKYEDKFDKNHEHKKLKVMEVSPEEGKVIVEGANIRSKHMKPRKQGQAGGIVKVEGAVYASKVQLYCENCKAGRRAKVAFSTDEKTGKTVKTRVCAKCGKEI